MIYIFDNFENLIEIVKREDVIKCQLVQSINSFAELTIETPLDYINVFQEGAYIGVIDNSDNMQLFTYDISSEDTLTVKGIERGYIDLNTAKPVKDRRPKKVSGSAVMNIILENTGYELGHCDVDNLASASFYYLSPLECIKKVIGTWICEVRFRYTFANNRIIGRYVDLYKKQGEKTGLQFQHGDNVLKIKQEIKRSEIITALIGRGKGEEKTDENGEATGGYGRRIEFTDVVWSKANGKPWNKPVGKNYVELEAVKIPKLGTIMNGEARHKWGIYVNEDIEDPEVLLDLTYRQLIANSKPQYTYSVSVVDLNVAINLGDSIAVIHDNINLAVECRVIKIISDLLNPDFTRIELGEYYDYRTERQKSNSSALTIMNQKFDDLVSEQTDAFTEMVKQKIAKHKQEFDEEIRRQSLEFRLQHEANERLIIEKTEENKRKFNEKLEPFRQEARQSIEQLNQRANQLSNQLSTVEQRANTNVANAISQFNTTKEAIDDRIATVFNIFNKSKTNLNNDLSNLRLNLENRLAEMNRQSTTMLNDITEAKRKLSEADSKFVSNAILEQTVDEISQELQQISNVNEHTEEKFAEYRQNIDSKFEKIGNLTELASGTLISKVNEAKSTAEQSTRDIRTVITDLNTTKSNLNSVVATASQQSTKISDLTSKLNVTNNKVSEVVQTATEHTSKLSELNRKDTELQSQVNTVKQTVSEQSTSISNVNSRLNVTNTDLSNVKQTANAIETALTSGVTGNDIPTRINKFIEKKTAEGIYTTLSNSVGGRNYIRDYSMKNLVNKFMKLGSNVDWRFEAAQDNTAKSGYHIKATCVRAATGSNGFHYPLVDLRGAEYQGKQMTWSIDIKSSRNLNFYHIGFEANGLRSTDITINWQRVTKTFNVNFVKFWSFVFYSNQIQSGDVIYIRDAQLEDGVIATTARAAEDDFKSQLAEYKQSFDINSAKLSDVITKANVTASNLSNVEQTATRTLTELSAFKQTVNAAGYVNQTSMNNAITNTASGLRQEINRVEQSIDTKGFITSTVANQLVNAKADEYSRELTTVKKLIPKDFSGNLLLDSARNWTATSYFQVTYQLSEALQEGQVYTIALKWTLNNASDRGLYRPMIYCRGGLLGLTGPLDAGKTITMYDDDSGVWIATFKVPLKSQMSAQQRQKFEESPNFIEIYRWGSSTNVNRNDSHSNASVTCEFATLVKGGIALSKWQKSWSELDSNLTTLNTFKQNSEGTLLRYETTNNEQNRKIASLESGVNGINLSVQTVSNKVATVTNNLNSTNANLNNLANQVVKHSEVNVTDNGVSIGSKQILNGQTLTSMITVNPNNVKVISDNMVLTNQSSNLLATIDRDIYCNKRDTTSNIIISEKIKNGDKFLLKFKGYKQTSHRVNVLFYITYTDNTNTWLPIRIDDKTPVRVYDGRSYYDFETDYTLAGLDNSKTVRDFRMGYQIDTRSNFGTLYVEHAELYQKRDANLIVDGSIKAKHIDLDSLFANTGTIEHLKSTIAQIDTLDSRIANIAERLILGDSKNPQNSSVILNAKGQSFIDSLRTNYFDSAYINTLNLSANSIKSGEMRSFDNAYIINLGNKKSAPGIYFNSNSTTIERTNAGFPTQFLNMRIDSAPGKSQGTITRTLLGSNRKGTKEFNGWFTGVGIEAGDRGNNIDRVIMLGDIIRFNHTYDWGKLDGETQEYGQGWEMVTDSKGDKIGQIFKPIRINNKSEIYSYSFTAVDTNDNRVNVLREINSLAIALHRAKPFPWIN